MNSNATNRLLTYLKLERLMMALDDRGHEEQADQIRVVMDYCWHRMSDSEREFLNQRSAVHVNSTSV